MPKNPMTAALMALAMLAPTAALADLWNDTPMRDADMYFNEILIDLDFELSDTSFTRQACQEGDGSDESASCSMLIIPVAFLSVHGTSLDEPPTSANFILAKTDEVLSMIQAFGVLAAGISPESTKTERGKLIEAFGEVAETREAEVVAIGGSEYVVAFTPGIGFSMDMTPIE